MAADEKFGSVLIWAEYTLFIIAIGFTGVFVPLLSYVASVFMPLPIVFIVMRYDLKYGLLGLGCAVLIISCSLQQNQPEIALSLIQHGMIGIVLGSFFKKFASSGRILVLTVAIAVGLAAMAAGAAYLHNGANPFVLTQAERMMLSQQWSAMNNQMHLIEGEAPNNAASDQETDAFQYLTELYQYYLPGQMVVTAAATAGFTYILTFFLLGRYGYKIPPGPAFSELYLPWYGVWGLIIGLGLLLLGDAFSAMMVKTGKNLLFILANLYFVIGLSVFVHFYKKIKVALLLKVLFLFTISCFYPFTIICLISIGAIDSLANFRRLPALK